MVDFVTGASVFAIDVLSRVVHVGTAMALVGGSLFMAVILLPSLGVLTEQSRQDLVGSVRDRWRRFVHGGIGLFVVSGFYNYFRAMPSHKGDGLYHALVGIKVLLAMVVFFLATVMVGRSSNFNSLRVNPGKTLRLMLFLSLVIIFISGFVKVRGN